MDALFVPLTLIAVLICPLMMVFCIYHVVHMLRGGMGYKGHAAPSHDRAPAAETRLRELEEEVATLRRQVEVASAEPRTPLVNGTGGRAAHRM
jgi:hypothetical protein